MSKAAKNELTGDVIVDLYYPLSIMGKVIDKLVMRRPKVRDMKAAQRTTENQADYELALAALVSGYVPEDFEEMDAADYAQIQDTFRLMQKPTARPLAADGATGEAVSIPAE